MSSPNGTTRSEVSLPSREFSIQQWKAGDGVYVNRGDVVAIASDVTSGGTVPNVVGAAQHCRPRVRGRKSVESTKTAPSNVEHPKVDLQEKSTGESSQLISINAPASGILQKIKQSFGNGDRSSLIVAYISPCTHPAVIENLCAVCGKPTIPDENNSAAYVPSSGRKQQMEHVTVSGGITMKVSESEAMSISESQNNRLKQMKKLSLVLDLDHTIVHGTADPRAAQYEDREDVRALLLPTEMGRMMHHRVKLRPHIKAFLQQSHYEITVYTAGTRVYAEQITMVLSRYMVGATLDHYGIIKLQQRVQNAERRNQASSQKKQEENLSQLLLEATSVDLAVPADSATLNATSDQGDSVESISPPRKRVRFGELAANIKSDDMTMTVEALEQLRAELKEAENKENEALDVRQRIFGSRIVSRSDVGDLGRDVKSLKRIFPDGGKMSVIVDDREDVWANAKENSFEPPHNLLLVQPYHWKPFSGFADINNPSGADLSKLSERDKEDCSSANLAVDDDQQLLWINDILKHIHSKYYAYGGSIPVPDILKEMRSDVLKGCRIILSGLVPLHKQREDYQGARHPLLRYTESMGAKLMTSVDPSLTHVVAATDGTEKIVQARRIPGCFIVKSSWLMQCYWSLKRCQENDHILGRPPFTTPSVSPGDKHPLRASTDVDREASPLSNNTDEDDDDEAFEDDLWGSDAV